MDCTVKTERLVISPLSDDEMRGLIEREDSPEMKQAYSEMLAGCLAHPSLRIWNAVWLMRLSDSGEAVGDLCFKGLGEDGMVEIGYGMKPEFEGRGLMTEAVRAMCRWASVQEGVSCVEAETDPGNAASQRVLEKAGFEPLGIDGEEGPRFIYKG